MPPFRVHRWMFAVWKLRLYRYFASSDCLHNYRVKVGAFICLRSVTLPLFSFTFAVVDFANKLPNVDLFMRVIFHWPSAELDIARTKLNRLRCHCKSCRGKKRKEKKSGGLGNSAVQKALAVQKTTVVMEWIHVKWFHSTQVAIKHVFSLNTSYKAVSTWTVLRRWAGKMSTRNGDLGRMVKSLRP